MTELSKLSTGALDELRAVFTALNSDAVAPLLDELSQAGRLALYGVGREGLMMKAFAMRLFHLGFDAYVVGDMTTPPVGPGDLLVVSAGPGTFSTVLALMSVAQEAGARTLVVTARPNGEATKKADVILYLPAQTMADDRSAEASVLPMGSLFEVAQLLFFEFVIILLRERLGRSADEMRNRHTNLE